ncbi:TPA: LysR family transcriptional regulator [Klebsiella pneumoniae]|uniref:LysR family transcriptional regulator n=1 Tax=Klebsiella pneumoniae TaxID=573 RepID=UPI000E2AB652|nr:LysR family transcriptional regulator [Klebsiella pneumoniae]EKW4985651.1 LysR family transcriptional regulator [Klebsiella pneumoniae]ELI0163802.1 LysR family transcriptional regulator [Klebsiella pneumoniae]ELS4677084.1 LysR family transcriptional regulator [Klebsiella pneumoniae]MBK0517164.1 LysR family transcriptional regulator [Klebsiella pneumoniae]MBK0599096.1 LysR family transcriptional regulator [Klebsiella pneumoniae]
MKSELLGTKASVTIADFGCFTRAADELNLSQPALTRRVKKLEEHLKVSLFERTTRKVTLTYAGKALLPHARALLDYMDNAILSVQELAAHQKGVIKLSCIPTATFYFLPLVLEKFNSLYPNIRVHIHEQATMDSLDSLMSGETDFGINMNRVTHPQISFTPLVDEPYILVCRRDHPLATKKLVEWNELASHRLIGIRRTSGNRILIEQEIAQTAGTLEWFYEVRHYSTAIGLVEAGLGIAALPCMAMSHHQHESLVSIPLVEPVIRRSIGLIRRNDVPLSPIAERLVNLFLEMWFERKPEKWTAPFDLFSR